MIVILVPSFLLFDNLMADASGWLTVAWVLCSACSRPCRSGW